MRARGLIKPRVHSKDLVVPLTLTGGPRYCARVQGRGCDLASLTVGPARQRATVQVENVPVVTSRPCLDLRLRSVEHFEGPNGPSISAIPSRISGGDRGAVRVSERHIDPCRSSRDRRLLFA